MYCCNLQKQCCGLPTHVGQWLNAPYINLKIQPNRHPGQRDWRGKQCHRADTMMEYPSMAAHQRIYRRVKYRSGLPADKTGAAFSSNARRTEITQAPTGRSVLNGVFKAVQEPMQASRDFLSMSYGGTDDFHV